MMNQFTLIFLFFALFSDEMIAKIIDVHLDLMIEGDH